MASTVYRGSDGTIAVAVEPGLEGDKAFRHCHYKVTSKLR